MRHPIGILGTWKERVGVKGINVSRDTMLLHVIYCPRSEPTLAQYMGTPLKLNEVLVPGLVAMRCLCTVLVCITLVVCTPY